jgi:hypothetical protein
VREGRKEHSVRWLLFAWEKTDVRRKQEEGEEKREKNRRREKERKKERNFLFKLGNFWKK